MNIHTPPPIVPPAPTPPAKDLSTFRLVRQIARNSLAIWPEHAFDDLLVRRSTLGIDNLLVNDPEGLRHVFSANAENYRRTLAQPRILRPLAGDGVLLSEGMDWRRQRRMLAPLFTPKTVDLLIPHFHEAAANLLRQIEGAPTANLALAFQHATSDAVLRALFSLPAIDSRDALAALLAGYITGAGRPNVFDLLAKRESDYAFATRRRRRFQREWLAAVDVVIAARNAAKTSSQQRDLLDLLLAARDPETGGGLTDAEIRAQCSTILAAGFETTSRLLFWAAYLLTLDTAEQARIRAEIAAFPPERVASLDDLSNWPRLRQTLLEAMRLYPPAPHMTREAIGPDVVAGQAVRPGTQVWVSIWVMHRHRRFWEHPIAFMPDRFAGKALSWTANGAFMPFGAGPRICLGASFALAEAQIILATLLSRHALSIDDPWSVEPVANFTIFPAVEPAFRLG